MDKMPERVICYYPAGRVSKLEVCVELFMKEWPHQEYIRADLPREVDFRTILKKFLELDLIDVGLDVDVFSAKMVLDYLAALGVIKDKGV